MAELSDRLVSVLEEIVKIDQQGTAEIRKVRSRGDGMADLLHQRLEGDVSGNEGWREAYEQQKERWKTELPRQQEQFRATEERSRRRQTVNCDAQQLLMRLYAFPGARDFAERISDRLRAVALLAVEPTPELLCPPLFPDPASEDPAGDSTDLCRRMSERMLPFMASMDSFHQKASAHYDRLMERESTYLREALDLARELRGRSLYN